MGSNATIKPVKVTRKGNKDEISVYMAEQYLLNSANAMRAWLAENDKIATGRTINGFKVVIDTVKLVDFNPAPFGLANKRRTKSSYRATISGFNVTLSPTQAAAREVYKVVKKPRKTPLIVRGRLLGVPWLDSVLYGRGAGSPPPYDKIEEWIRAKNVEGVFYNSEQRLARAISWKIAKYGTNPPFAPKNYRRKIYIPILRNIIRRSLPYITDEATEDLLLDFSRNLTKINRSYKLLKKASRVIDFAGRRLKKEALKKVLKSEARRFARRKYNREVRRFFAGSKDKEGNYKSYLRRRLKR